MELSVLELGGAPTGKMTVPDSVFARKFNAALVSQAVSVSLANARQGTRAQKTRAQVRHTTRKPWRQKGSGRARSGSSASPIWRGGGRAFPSLPEENFKRRMPRKMWRGAMAAVLSRLAAENRLAVSKTLAAETPRTRDLAAKLSADGWETARRILLVDLEMDGNLQTASRNIGRVRLARLSALPIQELVAADRVVVSENVVKRIAEMWS